MMTHDPFQNYQTQGAYSGGATPFGLPYTAFQPSFNPAAMAGQPQTNPGMGGYGAIPHPLQGVGIAGQLGLLQQILALNPLAAAGLQNPLLAAGLQHPLTQGQWQNPLLAYQGWPQQQSGYQQQQPQFQTWPQQQPQSGYQQQQPQFQGWPQQPQQQFGYPLAPQSLIGAGGIGQIHPLLAQALAQAGLRPATGYGMSPLAGSF
jgi:hypothetical protein